MKYTDKEILDAILNNDKIILSKVYKYCYPLISKQAFYCRYKGDLKDVMQDTMMIILENFRSGKFQCNGNYRFPAYFTATAYNVIRNYKRLKHSISFEAAGFNDIGNQDEFLDELYSREIIYRIIQNKILKLDDTKQQIIKLSLQGFTNIEIGKKMQLDANRVAKIKHQGIGELRKMILDDPLYHELN